MKRMLSMETPSRRRINFLRYLLTLCLTLTACQPGAIEETELASFADTFRAANQASKIEPMLVLYELEGATDSTVALLKNALLYEQGLPIRSIGFEALSGTPEENIDFTHQGIEYGPTVEPLYRMRVRYATEDHFESLFTIGKNPQGEWRIVSARPL
jgi:hypothetical protein